MKVKIGFTDWVDSEKIRMCIQLTRKEANDISKMHPLCTIYAQIPEKIDQEDSQSVRDWMYTGTKKIQGDINIEEVPWIERATDWIYNEMNNRNFIDLRTGDVIKITKWDDTPDVVGRIWVVESFMQQTHEHFSNMKFHMWQLALVSFESGKLEQRVLECSNFVGYLEKEFQFEKLRVTWDPNNRI